MSIFNLFKRKKSLDDIISDSFYEKGRWQETSVNTWTDTKTGATLTCHRLGDMQLNGVTISDKVHNVFWDVIYTIPAKNKKKAQLDALERLYRD